jgi:hypothetical protein
MSKNDSAVEPITKKNALPVPADADKKGCATSFLTGKNNEQDKLCGELPVEPKKPYVQPDEEKESGGEG